MRYLLVAIILITTPALATPEAYFRVVPPGYWPSTVGNGGAGTATSPGTPTNSTPLPPDMTAQDPLTPSGDPLPPGMTTGELITPNGADGLPPDMTTGEPMPGDMASGDPLPPPMTTGDPIPHAPGY